MALSSVAALSSNAEATTSNGALTVCVKQERPDEAEIRELAAKMVEANKAKMASTAKPPTPAGPLPQLPSHLVQPGQPGIMNFLTRNAQQGRPGGEKEKKPATVADGEKKPPCDEESARGRFGWVTLGKCHIPFIFRYTEKYCAVRMVELKLLNKYLSYLHSDIYSCTCIRSYYITDVEARLLNEINVKHCEGQFGREPFTAKDLVVRLQDAAEFFNFLDVCYNKLIHSSSNPKDKCGFIRINGESVVPYTVRDSYKYVPLFYFEGETDNLKLKAEKLEGWDLAYLKFCCKVQGIRNELFASETCSVISLNDIKSYFPPGTVFEDYWPSKVVDSQLLLGSSKGVVASAGMWTKQPGLPPGQQHSATTATPVPQVAATNKVVTTPPSTQPRAAAVPPQTPVALPVNLSAASAVAVQAMCNGWAAGLVGGQSAYQPNMVQQPSQQIRMTQASPMSMHSLNTTVNSTSRSYNPVRPRPGHQYYPQVSLPMTIPTQNPNHIGVAQPPPPLVRVTGAAPPSLGSSGTYTSSSGGLNLPNVTGSSLHLMGLSDPSHQMMPPPPQSGSLPYAHSTSHSPHYSPPVMGTSQPQQQRLTPPSGKYPPPPLIPVNGTRYPTNMYSTSADVIDLSSPPQSPHRPTMGNGRSSSGGSSTSSSTDPGSSGRKLIQLSETPTTGNHNPYQVQKALVEGKMVPCINSKPYIYSELLMTLPDLVSHFFPSVPLSSCRQILQEVLGVELYRGNRQQMTILRDSGKCQSTQDTLPLVQVRDVMQFMPQMKYMFTHARMSAEENPSKRQRTS